MPLNVRVKLLHCILSLYVAHWPFLHELVQPEPSYHLVVHLVGVILGDNPILVSYRCPKTRIDSNFVRMCACPPKTELRASRHVRCPSLVQHDCTGRNNTISLKADWFVQTASAPSFGMDSCSSAPRANQPIRSKSYKLVWHFQNTLLPLKPFHIIQINCTIIPKPFYQS